MPAWISGLINEWDVLGQFSFQGDFRASNDYKSCVTGFESHGSDSDRECTICYLT
jgi:hypothetical protein